MCSNKGHRAIGMPNSKKSKKLRKERSLIKNGKNKLGAGGIFFGPGRNFGGGRTGGILFGFPKGRERRSLGARRASHQNLGPVQSELKISMVLREIRIVWRAWSGSSRGG